MRHFRHFISSFNSYLERSYSLIVLSPLSLVFIGIHIHKMFIACLQNSTHPLVSVCWFVGLSVIRSATISSKAREVTLPTLYWSNFIFYLKVPWSTGDKGEGRPGGEHRGLPVQQHGRGQGAAQGHIIHWSQGNQRLKKKLLQSKSYFQRKWLKL